jgi:hypothetical protein
MVVRILVWLSQVCYRYAVLEHPPHWATAATLRPHTTHFWGWENSIFQNTSDCSPAARLAAVQHSGGGVGATSQAQPCTIAATPLVFDHIALIPSVTPPYLRRIIFKGHLDPKLVFSCRSSSSVSIFNLLRNYASRDHHTSSRPMRQPNRL